MTFKEYRFIIVPVYIVTTIDTLTSAPNRFAPKRPSVAPLGRITSKKKGNPGESSFIINNIIG